MPHVALTAAAPVAGGASATERPEPASSGGAVAELASARGQGEPVAAGGAIVDTLADAYRFSPELNSARAGTRATDETLPQAKAAFLPSVAGGAGLSTAVSVPDPGASTRNTGGNLSLSVQQNIFQGFRNVNAIRSAKANIEASRENLANTEQNVLFDAASAYLAVVRDQEILKVRQANISFLEKSVQATTDRFEGGEATKTDISQAEARLAGARSDLSLADAALRTSKANFRRIVGRDPNVTTAYFPYTRLLPNTLPEAVSIAQADHPVVLSAIYQADSSGYAVKQAEGALLPSLTLSGAIGQDYGLAGDSSGTDTFSGSVRAGLSVPLYQRGAVSSQIRQAKETEGQSKIGIDLARDQVLSAVVTAWSQWVATKDSVAAAAAQVAAASASLNGVQEEQKVGQRTELDVLDAQQELLNAQLNQIQIQDNQVLSAFSLLSAMGQLRAESLGLPVQIYRPEEHYDAVKNKFFGVRTPDGR